MVERYGPQNKKSRKKREVVEVSDSQSSTENSDTGSFTVYVRIALQFIITSVTLLVLSVLHSRFDESDKDWRDSCSILMKFYGLDIFYK